MISQTILAPNGVTCETMSCWFSGGPVGGRGCANCFMPRAVIMLMMLVSWLKSK